ncbi:MAG TPA: helix-turn-helix domain-containing protein [Phycisphaerae bacterium]|nr:helix-turn-helix domain-containing protein [Phycisphaerae bacterium]
MAKLRKSVSCPVESTLHVIGGRWKVLVIYQLLGGVRRFNELHRLLRGVSPRTLARQLRELERDGVVRRKVYPEIPPHVEYSLTPLGKSLEPILMAMDKWAEGFSHRVPTHEE